MNARIYQTDGKEIDYISRESEAEYMDKADTSELPWQGANTHIDLTSDGEGNGGELGQANIALEDKFMEVDDQEMEYIPKEVAPRGRNWISSEQVNLVTENGSWIVTILVSNGRGRFSAGWNAFVRDNKLKGSKPLLFTLIENNEEISFSVE
ncbi:hypothetical protein AG4045_014462 [Apium graveolens]|uniref:TF-B3 domain-containing protein n=1 Tax=Apium graveolens TaxID=4045 RepID=A0A6L5B7X1_APIGR|nr:hypothetical protein AG4045_014462 [Apium graveolens]